MVTLQEQLETVSREKDKLSRQVHTVSNHVSSTCHEHESYYCHTHTRTLVHTHTHAHTQTQVAVLERRVRDKEQHVRSLSEELKTIRVSLQAKEGERRKPDSWGGSRRWQLDTVNMLVEHSSYSQLILSFL